MVCIVTWEHSVARGLYTIVGACHSCLTHNIPVLLLLEVARGDTDSAGAKTIILFLCSGVSAGKSALLRRF